MLPLGQEMPHEVGNGMGLPCAGRPLHHHSGSLLYFPGYGQLFGIGRLGKQNISRLATGIGENLLLPSLLKDNLGRTEFRVHNFQQGLGDFSALFYFPCYSSQSLGKAGIMTAQENTGPGIDKIPVCGQELKTLGRCPAMGRNNGGCAVKEFPELAGQGMYPRIIHPGGKFLQPLPLDARQILKELHI